MNSKKQRIKKPLLIGLVAAVLLSGTAFAANRIWGSDDAPKATNEQTINYGPATETEKEENEANKDRIVSEQKQNSEQPGSTSASGKKAVVPTITSANQGNVSAYVSGIFEEGGTCTATFTKGSTTLTKTAEAFQNASYTQCAPITLDSGFLSSGSWSVVVSYASAKAEGRSESKSIEVN